MGVCVREMCVYVCFVGMEVGVAWSRVGLW